MKYIGHIYRLRSTVGTRLRSHHLQQINSDALGCCSLHLCAKSTFILPATTRQHTIRVFTHWYGSSKNLSTRDLVYIACFLNPEKGAHVGQYFTAGQGYNRFCSNVGQRTCWNEIAEQCTWTAAGHRSRGTLVRESDKWIVAVLNIVPMCNTQYRSCGCQKPSGGF